ncbi:MAG: TonB-dependent receptor, partial [Acidobacteriota bacterium]
YQTTTTETGNYTLAQLPAGPYQLTANAAGFKAFVRQNISVQVAQVLRLDVPLEIGSATESVTVTAEVSLLKTESGELSHNIPSARMNSLPVLAIGAAAGSSGIRNPQSVAALLPGTFVQPNATMRVNGAPSNTASYRIEGMDATNGQVPATQAQVQPSMDAIQEVTIQTSNFSAEYGQVGGGFFNYAMKSGTNQYHGSAYDYMVNEVLNANTPWVNTVRPVSRRHDYGFTFGGPVKVPGIYDGKNKTFFFFNWEQYRENQSVTNQAITLPLQAYRDGDFARALTGRVLCAAPCATTTDPLGRAVLEGTIYDPASDGPAPNGARLRNPFPNNLVPVARMDPVSLNIQRLIPAGLNRPGFTTSLINNSVFPYRSQRVTSIPSIKLDHYIGSNLKLAYFWDQTRTASQFSPTLGGSDGLPNPISAAIGTFITARKHRLNLDYTMRPTLLLHLGVGYQNDYFTDDAPVLDYNPEASLGLRGATINRLFPALQGLSNAQGGMKNMGPNGNRHPLLYEKPTTTVSASWVTGNHTYKFGGELRLDSNLSYLYTNTNGVYGFSGNQTAMPNLASATISGGTIGFPYASFLLGLVDSVRIAPLHNIRLGKHQIGLFAQDTWKVTRKLTVDYGLRWDFQSYLKEQYARLAQFAPLVANPAAGGLLGAVQFESSGPGHCNCNFAKNYPLAFGPRLGIAYQINSKTVLRAGWGIVYNTTGDANGATQGGLTAPQAVNSPAFGDSVMSLRTGIPFTPLPFPNFDAGQYPQAGYATTQAPPTWYDQNAGRPARQMQWSVGLQREFMKDFVVEASYVANRGVWWNSPGLIDVNALTPQSIRAAGLDINNAADRAILTARVNTATAAQFRNRVPYNGFPATATVAQSLRPYPQFSSINALWAPLGDTWYDSLQVKVTKRFSHGVDFTSTFTKQKNLATGAPANVVAPGTGGGAYNDVFNRPNQKFLSSFDQPMVFNMALNYTAPALHFKSGMAGQAVSWAARDWTIGLFMQYASGLPIIAPAATQTTPLTNMLFRGTFSNRVADQPLHLQDINCHCYDPNKEFVLNPAAWAAPAEGNWGSSAAFFTDYRFQRRPVENLAVGRTFRFGERGMTLNLRAEFSNIMNRAQAPNPGTALTTQTRTNGVPSAGFGFVNTGSVAATSPRQGTLVGRFTF